MDWRRQEAGAVGEPASGRVLIGKQASHSGGE